jgi:hypothetical protein
MKFAIACMECGKVAHAPWPENAAQLSDFMQSLWRECRYVMSVATMNEGEAGAKAEIQKTEGAILTPLCEACALKIHGPECMHAVAEEMDKRAS